MTACERAEIRVGITRAETNAGIARRLGRHRSTIGREVVRYAGRGDYTASAAQARADACRARPKDPMFVADPKLAGHITARLEAKDSPMTISIELARGTRGLPKGLHAGQHHRRSCCKHRRPPGETPLAQSSPLGAFNLSHARPAVAAGRVEVGHLEGDLIIGERGQSPDLGPGQRDG